MHLAQRENLLKEILPVQRGEETISIKRGASPTDVFSGTHMAGWKAGYLRAHTAL